MYPNVFVAERFLDEFDSCYKQLNSSSIYEVDSENENKKASLQRIRDLLLSSNVYSDISDKSLIKYYTKQFGTYSNIKDLVFGSLIKENAFKNCRKLASRKQKEDCYANNFCYFTNNEFEECETQQNSIGKIIIGKKFLNEDFYLEQTFPVEPTDEKISQIEKAKHPCTSLVIIDKYLFEDAPKYQSKIPNLIHFLKQLIPTNLTVPFEIDIIISNPENNTLVNSKYQQILDAFANKISLHIYAPRHIQETTDRYLITNYGVFAIGHPFDRQTDISCNFYPSNNTKEAIKSSYKTWLSKINLAKDLINKTPNNYGLIVSVWQSDNLKHSIFNF